MFKALALAAALGASPFDYSLTNPEVVISATDEASIDRLAEGFFKALKAGEYQRAYSEAFTSPLMKKRVLELEQIATQSETTFKTYGAVKDWELFGAQKPSKNFIRRFYLVRTESTPLFFTVEFYHVDGKWMILNLTFVDRFVSLQ